MILVTGATGNFGKLTINFLLKKGITSTNIVALVRDETKAEELKTKGVIIKIGDYGNYDSLVEAFQGVDKLLLVSSSDLANSKKHHENVLNAAKQSSVKHILYTSIERKNETTSSPISFVSNTHIATEKLIKASGMPYTIFRNNLYLDMLPIFFGKEVLETGVFLPTGDTRTAFALRKDMAEAAANVLMGKGHENKEYALSNTENVSFAEMAKSLSEVVGKEIGYVNPMPELFVDTLTKTGAPKEYIGMLAGFSEAIKQGDFERYKTDLENLLGRKPISAKEFFKEVYAS